MAERVAENLNAALHGVLAADPAVHLFGEDVADPYGGAFRVTKGLSTAFPDRVWSTPLSEGALVGVASGLALAGDKAIVEIMFGDFVALAFDQILNFASKSVSMYGRTVPMPLVVRCPVGGGRGYGPTHSQSLQKHFLGIPDLALFEVSPFRDNAEVLAEALDRDRPALLFEDKVLYTRRMAADAVVDDLFRYDLLPGGTALVHLGEPEACDAVVLVPGGLAERALGAARTLLLEDEIACQVAVPSRLHPIDLDPLWTVLGRATAIVVAEEGTPGGSWGAEVAHAVHTRLWDRLRGPVTLVHSRDSVIPTAAHLERAVVAGVHDIRRAVKGALGG